MDTGTATFNVRTLDPAQVRLFRDAFGALCLTIGEDRHENVRAVRTFPLTAPDKYISMVDSEGKEIGVLEDVRHLDAETRRCLEDDLEMMYFTPHVQSILEVKSRFGISTWTLQTDRGTRVACVKDRSDIRTLRDGRIIITDVHGIRYEITDPAALDERSLGFLEAES